MSKPKPEKPLPRKRVRRSPEAARQHILDAAIRVISKYGPSGCGLKEVAAEAGTSHALITHYFGTYDGLVDAVMDEAVTQVRQRLIARMIALPDPNPSKMIQLYLEIAMEPWHCRLLSWAAFDSDERTAKLADRYVDDMRLMAGATKQVFESQGVKLTREEAEALLVSAWALGVGYASANAFFWRALGRKPNEQAHRALSEVVARLTRGLSEPVAATPKSPKRRRS